MIKHTKIPFLHIELNGDERLIAGQGNTWQYFQEEWGDDSMPQTYYCQCLHYMNVTGAEFVVLFGIAMMPWCDETKTIIRRIERSEVLLDLMQLEADEEAFWKKHIVEDIEPNFI